jgi:arylsulfatase A-like enzyme
MTRPNAASVVGQGLVGGLLWGWAVGMVHLAVGVGLIVVLTVPPMTGFTARSIVYETAIALVAGLALSPLLLLKHGRWVHIGALALVWLGLERWVAVDPTRLQMWVAPTVVALVLIGIGAALYRRWPLVPLALALTIPPVLVAVPVINYWWGGYGAESVAQRELEQGPDVLFIVMDTVRAKSVSAYGYDRQTTPNFDALAKEGALYTEATTSATWSLPAHASLFTGHYPSSHEAHDETRRLDDRLPTLAQTLAEKGWRSLAFSANPYISDTFGLVRGFDWTDKAWRTGEGGRQFSFVYRFIDRVGFSAEDKGGRQVVENLRSWMASRPDDDTAAFVFVNFLEAHFPFNQLPEEFLYEYAKDTPASTLASASQTAFGVQFGRQLTPDEIAFVQQPLVDMYDGGVKYTDHLVGQVLDLWRERGTLDNTIVIIVGDHGEMMGEHGSFGHVTSMYQPDLHVPLTVRYPSRIPAGTVVSDPITTTGLFATVMDLLGEDPPDLQAGTLVPGPYQARSPVLTERFEEEMLASRFAPGTANGKGPLLQPHGRYRAYREGSLKYVESTKNGGPWLFDLAADPNEDHDLAGAQPEKLAEMKTTLDALLASKGLKPLDAPVGTVEKPVMTLEECLKLLALGYVDNCDHLM